MGYQIKLEILAQPKKQMAELEQRATEMAINDCALFLENTMHAAMQAHRRTGKTESAIKKIVFRIKLSAKVYFDLNIAPHALELMRGNKQPRVIEARGKAMVFTIQGRQMFAKRVTKPKTRGLRIPEKMRQSPAVNARLREIFAKHLNVALTGKSEIIVTGPVIIT